MQNHYFFTTPTYFANDYMQYMHPTYLYNEIGSSSNAFQMNTTPPQFELNNQPQPLQENR